MLRLVCRKMSYQNMPICLNLWAYITLDSKFSCTPILGKMTSRIFPDSPSKDDGSFVLRLLFGWIPITPININAYFVQYLEREWKWHLALLLCLKCVFCLFSNVSFWIRKGRGKMTFMQTEGLQFLPTLKYSGAPHWYLYLEFEERKCRTARLAP